MRPGAYNWDLLQHLYTTRDNVMQKGNVIGLIGWRGMVGSVLMHRMQEEADFDLISQYSFPPQALVLMRRSGQKTKQNYKMLMILKL